MKRIVADANLFLRYLLNDIPAQYKVAKKLFSDAKLNRVEIVVPQVIIFEVLFGLDKYYHFPKLELIEKLESLIGMEYFKIQDREIFQKALDVYKGSNLSLVDCFLIVKAEYDDGEIFTFDKKLGKYGKSL